MLRIDTLRVGAQPPISFEVAPGACVGVEGPSGSGKTRLLRAIADLDEAEGYVYLDGEERGEMPAPAWRRRVRYVSAEPAWWADTPRAHMPRAARLDGMAAALGLDPDILDRPVAHLSTGERQRLGLMRALADEPVALLLDEPTSALDAAAAATVEGLIQVALRAGRIVVLVSHDQGLIERLAGQRIALAAPAAERAA
ncbi:MAG: ATP-binding cassette domain-containing protein [Hyphomicrobiaceae bacterium]|nr:ATP-binding cassette domain-containing protein [Hyphomicrobiaceae bacterium]